MERRDLELIEQHARSNKMLDGLYKEHIDFKRKLEKLDSKHFLTPKEEIERKKLQKEKLLGKDKIEMILQRYRKEHVMRSH